MLLKPLAIDAASAPATPTTPTTRSAVRGPLNRRCSARRTSVSPTAMGVREPARWPRRLSPTIRGAAMTTGRGVITIGPRRLRRLTATESRPRSTRTSAPCPNSVFGASATGRHVWHAGRQSRKASRRTAIGGVVMVFLGMGSGDRRQAVPGCGLVRHAGHTRTDVGVRPPFALSVRPNTSPHEDPPRIGRGNPTTGVAGDRRAEPVPRDPVRARGRGALRPLDRWRVMALAAVVASTVRGSRGRPGRGR